jgi:hypothetical protein
MNMIRAELVGGNYTVKKAKENLIFLIQKEIQPVQTHMYMTKYLPKPFLIYDFAPDRLKISLYTVRGFFSFLTV